LRFLIRVTKENQGSLSSPKSDI